MAPTPAPPRSNTHDHFPAPYRTSPPKLVLHDLGLAFRKSRYWIDIVWPPWTRNPNGELNIKDRGNRTSILLHAVILGITLAGTLLVPIFFVAGGVVWAGCCLAWWGAILAISVPLNGYGECGGVKEEDGGYTVIESGGKYARPFPREKWVFINGVMAGKQWTRSAVDELERRFHRKVYGVHNKTYGLILDLAQCIIQRALGWTSADIRAAYTFLRRDLLKRNAEKEFEYEKIVVVGHSQGALILSLVLDMLYADLAPDVVERLEVYTFGNAANHFNNPPIHDCDPLPGSQQPLGIIKHIEHYLNTHDFVSIFGVLEYAPRPPSHEEHVPTPDTKLLNHFHRRKHVALNPADETNEFIGTLFSRYGQPGHLFVQHYLDAMFGGYDNEDGADGVSEFEMSELEQRSRRLGKWEGKVLPPGLEKLRRASRLWGYRGGRTQD
ncbi:hypothetical protein RUND412_000396 [Rhizina undulata]